MSPLVVPPVVGAHQDEPVFVGVCGASLDRRNEPAHEHVSHLDGGLVLRRVRTRGVRYFVGITDVDERRIDIAIGQAIGGGVHRERICAAVSLFTPIKKEQLVDGVAEQRATRRGCSEWRPVRHRKRLELRIDPLQACKKFGICRVVVPGEIVAIYEVFVGPRSDQHARPSRTAHGPDIGAGPIAEETLGDQSVDVGRVGFGEDVDANAVQADDEDFLGRLVGATGREHKHQAQTDHEGAGFGTKDVVAHEIRTDAVSGEKRANG